MTVVRYAYEAESERSRHRATDAQIISLADRVFERVHARAYSPAGSPPPFEGSSTYVRYRSREKLQTCPSHGPAPLSLVEPTPDGHIGEQASKSNRQKRSRKRSWNAHAAEQTARRRAQLHHVTQPHPRALHHLYTSRSRPPATPRRALHEHAQDRSEIPPSVHDPPRQQHITSTQLTCLPTRAAAPRPGPGSISSDPRARTHARKSLEISGGNQTESRNSIGRGPGITHPVPHPLMPPTSHRTIAAPGRSHGRARAHARTHARRRMNYGPDRCMPGTRDPSLARGPGRRSRCRRRSMLRLHVRCDGRRATPRVAGGAVHGSVTSARRRRSGSAGLFADLGERAWPA